MRKIHQPPLSVPDQIRNLEELGLIIKNESDAVDFLNDVSYFRLIKAYSLGLKEKNGLYHANVSFDTIVQLYKFNADFRQLLFSVIERIEINLRCRLSNHFSVKYGVFGYQNADNFSDPGHHASFLREAELEISRNAKSPFVRNFLDNYEAAALPFYALVELLSFGTLSKFFKNMKSEDKKAVASYYRVGYTYLESWIESIAFVRNVCAHYGRLYNAKLSKTPLLYKEYTRLGIKNIRIFGLILCMMHLDADPSHREKFVNKLDHLFQEYPAVKIETMGFPPEWKSLLLRRTPTDSVRTRPLMTV